MSETRRQATTPAGSVGHLFENAASFETELVGGELSGMCPHRSVDGALWFRQLWEVTAALEV